MWTKLRLRNQNQLNNNVWNYLLTRRNSINLTISIYYQSRRLSNSRDSNSLDACIQKQKKQNKAKETKASRLPNSALFYSWEEEGEEMLPMVIKQTRRIRLKINRQVQPHTLLFRCFTKPKVPCTIADESSRFFKANPLEKSTAHYPVMVMERIVACIPPTLDEWVYICILYMGL